MSTLMSMILRIIVSSYIWHFYFPLLEVLLRLMMLECYLCRHLAPQSYLSVLKVQSGAIWAISKRSLCLWDKIIAQLGGSSWASACCLLDFAVQGMGDELLPINFPPAYMKIIIASLCDFQIEMGRFGDLKDGVFELNLLYFLLSFCFKVILAISIGN